MNSASQTKTITAAGTTAWPGWLPLVVLPAATICVRNRMPAWLFMWALSFAIYAALKWMTWWTAHHRVPASVGRSLAYLLAWPGMDAETFLDARDQPGRPRLKEWLWATTKSALGVLLIW